MLHGPLEWIALVALGAALGWLGGLLGIGGGLFAIPILALLFGLDQQHAQGTSMVMVMPNVLYGLWNYAKRERMEPKIAWSLALAAFPVTILFARLAVVLPSARLRLAFAIFLLAIAVFIGFRTWLAPKDDAGSRTPVPWYFALVLGVMGGVLSGLFSVGGAVFSVPLVAWLYVVPQRVAQGYGLALVAPGTVAAIATYALAGDVVWWPTGICLAVGGLIGVPSGVALAHRLPDRALKLSFVALMVVSGITLLVRG